MTRTVAVTLTLLSVLVMLTIASCRPGPETKAVHDAVKAYFSGRGYPVMEISIHDIRPLEAREKTYMGVPTYTVELDRLVLEVDGKQRTFTNVRLLLKQSRDQKDSYTVSDISGVPLP